MPTTPIPKPATSSPLPLSDGFGIEVSIATICRFYKANYDDIAEVRQEKLNDRGAEQCLYAETRNEFYRQNLAHGATLSLQERFYELLSRPVETIDQLKKLVYVCKQIQAFELPLDPERAQKDKLLQQLMGHPLDRFLKTGLKPTPQSDPGSISPPPKRPAKAKDSSPETPLSAKLSPQ